MVQGQLTSNHAPAFIVIFLSVWGKAYTQSNSLPSSQRTHWLSFAAPFLLELLGSSFSHNAVQQYISNTLPIITPSIIIACRTCFSCIPVRNGCPVRDSTVHVIQKWILQHPKESRGLLAPLLSTGVRWFLWAAAAGYAEGVYTMAPPGVLPVAKGDLQADYKNLSRLSYQDMIGKMAGSREALEAFFGELLGCLSQLYLVWPAEHGLKRLIQGVSDGAHGPNQQQQQQQHQHQHHSDSTASCSSSKSSSSSRDSSSSSRSSSSSGDGEEAVDEPEGIGSSSHGSASIRMQQDAPGIVREDWSSCNMEDLAVAAAAAAAYAPSGEGHVPSSSPADIRWLFLSVPSPSFSASSGTAAAGGAEEVVLPAAAGGAAPPAAVPLVPAPVPPVPAAAGGSGEPMPGIPGWYPAPPTLPQLLMVLELALLTWRAVGKGLKEEWWRCVLLLVGLLQQSSVEVRQQLMEQRGSLLLQLLYHVLREDTGLGGDGMSASKFGPFGLVPEAIAQDVVQKIND